MCLRRISGRFPARHVLKYRNISHPHGRNVRRISTVLLLAAVAPASCRGGSGIDAVFRAAWHRLIRQRSLPGWQARPEGKK